MNRASCVSQRGKQWVSFVVSGYEILRWRQRTQCHGEDSVYLDIYWESENSATRFCPRGIPRHTTRRVAAECQKWLGCYQSLSVEKLTLPPKSVKISVCPVFSCFSFQLFSFLWYFSERLSTFRTLIEIQRLNTEVLNHAQTLIVEAGTL